MLIEELAERWGVKDPLLEYCNPDLIELVSFGATKDRVTNGVLATTGLGLQLTTRHPAARVTFGVYTHSPDPGLEERWKRGFFKAAIFAGLVESTVEEAENVRDATLKIFLPKCIVVVTDEWHSPSAKLITEWAWRDVPDRPDIRIATVPSSATIDRRSPMIFARTHYTWASVNSARHSIVCRPGGIEWLKRHKLHQP